MANVMLPISKDLLLALLQILSTSPTALAVSDIESKVAKYLELTEEQLKVMRSGHRSEFSYRLAWERTHAKNKGFASRTSHSSWEISDLGRKFLLEN